jgi:hypothetical protein
MAKQIGSNKWQKSQSSTAAAFSPYKSFKEQIQKAVNEDGRAVVSASWLALRGIVRATVNVDAPKWGGMDDSALGKRIGMKNLAWAHVADAWGVPMAGCAFIVDAADPHYAAVRAQALAFRAAVTGQVNFGGIAPDFGGFAAVSTKNKIEKALIIAVNGGE